MTDRAATDDSDPGDVRTIAVAGLRLAFLWDDDRWAHTVIAGSDSVAALLARSIDRPAGGRIASPAYQQVHFQDAETARRALLVGQSARHHFSASFELRPEPDGSVALAADVADRITRTLQEPAPLACTYAVDLPPDDLEEASHRLVRWRTRAPAGQLVLRAAASDPTPTILVLSEAGPRGVLVQPIARFDPSATVQRCRYLWTWSPA